MSDRSFGFASTTSEVIAGLDLTSLSVVVTGASGGLGAESARALAEGGARVTLAARDTAKAEAVAEEIRKGTGNTKVDVLPLDLTRLQSIRDFTEAFRARHERLTTLLNNAGVMGCPEQRTERGWELQFATNHLGHFLLTALLAPQLVASAPARVVNRELSRPPFLGHRLGRHPLRAPPLRQVGSLRTEQDGQRALQRGPRRAAGRPGRAFQRAAPRRHLHRAGPAPEEGRHRRADVARPGRQDGVEAGAPGRRHLGLGLYRPGAGGEGGLYLDDCQIASPRTGDDDPGGYEPYARDPDSAERLWRVSEETVGEILPIAEER